MKSGLSGISVEVRGRAKACTDGVMHDEQGVALVAEHRELSRLRVQTRREVVVIRHRDPDDWASRWRRGPRRGLCRERAIVLLHEVVPCDRIGVAADQTAVLDGDAKVGPDAGRSPSFMGRSWSEEAVHGGFTSFFDATTTRHNSRSVTQPATVGVSHQTGVPINKSIWPPIHTFRPVKWPSVHAGDSYPGRQTRTILPS